MHNASQPVHLLQRKDYQGGPDRPIAMRVMDNPTTLNDSPIRLRLSLLERVFYLISLCDLAHCSA